LKRLIQSGSEALSCWAVATGHHQEGLCLLAQLGPYRVLLDCGLADCAALQDVAIDLAWCSQAHPHSAQGFSALHDLYPTVPIYGSLGSQAMLALDFCQGLPWASPTILAPNLTATIFPAGHLPGAAAIFLSYQGANRTYSLLYTGDFFLSNTRCTEGLSLELLRGYRPNVAIVCGSQGTARYPHRRRQESALVEQLNRLLQNHQSLVLLTPEFGQAPEILLLLRSDHQFAGRDIDLWLDEAIADECDRYTRCISHLPPAVQNFARNQPLFWDEKIRPRVRPLADRPQHPHAPEIILAKTPLAGFTTLVPTDWDGLIPNSIPYLLTNCADGAGTTQLIHNLRPQHVVFVHGSPTYLADLTALDELNSRYQLHLPSAGSFVELPIGETFLQPPTPIENSYEGELEELSSTINISFPASLGDDPRWQDFADTGLIEARWQGAELVLKGISAQQLLNQGERDIPDDVICCANCRYLRAQRCSYGESPLYGFKVTPTGTCPLFEVIL
jgi:Cft2 family RNA processing exonuclease